MIDKLHKIAIELETMVVNFTDPPESEMLATTSKLHNVRAMVIALDTMLHACHNRRHPIERQALVLGPTPPLSAEDRIDIDSTP